MRKPRRRRPSSRTIRLLAISLLILGVGRGPMPRAEYHVIAHQDGSGQVCSLHEHLLRWHPVAGLDHGDHAAFHWHWALPHPADPRGSNGTDDDSEESHVPPTGADLLVEEGPSVTHPTKSGLSTAIAHPSLLIGMPMTVGPDPTAHRGRAGPPGLNDPMARGPSRAAWLQRWTC